MDSSSVIMDSQPSSYFRATKQCQKWPGSFLHCMKSRCALMYLLFCHETSLNIWPRIFGKSCFVEITVPDETRSPDSHLTVSFELTVGDCCYSKAIVFKKRQKVGVVNAECTTMSRAQHCTNVCVVQVVPRMYTGNTHAIFVTAPLPHSYLTINRTVVELPFALWAQLDALYFTAAHKRRKLTCCGYSLLVSCEILVPECIVKIFSCWEVGSLTEQKKQPHFGGYPALLLSYIPSRTSVLYYDTVLLLASYS